MADLVFAKIKQNYPKISCEEVEEDFYKGHKEVYRHLIMNGYEYYKNEHCFKR